jgi:hypothetical protein
MDCVKDDGRVVDLDKVNDRVEWSRVSRRPDPLEGTNGMMMIMKGVIFTPKGVIFTPKITVNVTIHLYAVSNSHLWRVFSGKTSAK